MLGPLTTALVETHCPPDRRAAVRDLLAGDCATTLPGVGTTPDWIALIDRVQLAALRGSTWDLARIAKDVRLARTDWRDLLLGKGFGHDLRAHEAWQREALRTGAID